MRRHAPAVPAIIALLGASFVAGVATPAARDSPAAAFSVAARPAVPRAPGEPVETTVVGWRLHGASRYDRLEIPDLDIVVQEDGDRLLPLLRLLRILSVEVRDSASVLVFVPEGSPPVRLDVASRRVRIGETDLDAEMVAGRSDVTGEPEIYVIQAAMADILLMTIEWEPDLYQLTFRSGRPLAVFDRSLTRNRPAASGRSAFVLPGILPPAEAGGSILPRLVFGRIQLQSSIISRQNEERPSGTLSPPRAALWAEVLGGSLATRVSQRGESPKDGYKIDALTWNTAFEQAAVSLGSTNLGLSSLVFPSLSLVGAGVNGNVGSASSLEPRDPSQLGRRQTFAPLHVVDGFAPLGSMVALVVNGQTVESQRVEPSPGAPPGEGVYEFEGLNLFTSRLNEVRVVVTNPDGTVDERRRRVLGTDLLISKGRLAFIGGMGGRRRFTADNLSAGGRFGGGRFDYGASRRLSIGASGAFQKGLFRDDFFSAIASESLRTAPEQSLHLGARAVWQPFDPIVISTEAARSGWLAEAIDGQAFRGDVEYHIDQFRVHSGLFRYGPGFFDGQNAELHDVLGTSLGMAWRHGSGQHFGLSASRQRDNLDERRPATTRLSELQGTWLGRGLIPWSTLTIAGRQVWIEDVSSHQSFLVALESTLPGRWSLRGRYEFGDDIAHILRDELPLGASSRFDLSGRTTAGFESTGPAPGTGSLSSLFELRRRVGTSWQLNIVHRSASLFERTYVDLVKSATRGALWQTRTSAGYDWSRESPLLQNRIELFLENNRRNRISLETNYLDRRWLARLSLQVQLDMGFSGFSATPLFESRLDPDAGGVKGRVFLDENGNGLMDRGEEGISGIDVTTDQGRKAISGSGGLFVFPNSSSMRRARISLVPETLSAIYSPTQATQEVHLRQGLFAEVNLGVATLGTVSGHVLGRRDSTVAPETAAPGDTAALQGVPGVRVLLVSPDGQVAGNSITGRDGAYTIGDARPGLYTIQIDLETLPEGFVPGTIEIPVQVTSGKDVSEMDGNDFIGRFTAPPAATADEKEVRYKVFD